MFTKLRTRSSNQLITLQFFLDVPSHVDYAYFAHDHLNFGVGPKGSALFVLMT